MPTDPAKAVERVTQILGPQTADQLGHRGREALLAGTFLLAMCDGELAESEFFWVNAVATALGMDGDDIDVVSGEIDRESVGTRLAEAQLPIAARNAVIACLGLIAKADGELKDKEWAMIYAVGASLGRSARDCETVVSRVPAPK